VFKVVEGGQKGGAGGGKGMLICERPDLPRTYVAVICTRWLHWQHHTTSLEEEWSGKARS
jgi:hypothetical protein